VRRAFEAYGAVVAETSVYGGANGAITTRFGDAGTPMFGTPPGCLFTHQGSFMQAFFEAKGEKPTTDFDFFPFPTIEAANEGSVIGGGDLVGLVNDRPAARELIRYLVGKEAQALWVSKGGTLSVNGEVTDYPDAVSARAAEMLRSATRFRFDASDLMPKAMSDAFLSAVLAFTFDQRDLTTILARLDKVRATAYAN
jgi:alpha-glucoside transport system substrate-binding protein